MSMPREYNPEFLYLTTIGHITGKPHEIEIWYVAHGNCYYLISGGRSNAHWVKNILGNPQVSFWVQGQIYSGIGRAIDSANEPDLAEVIDELMYNKYQWNDGLIIELCAE